jgi:hypothetical protein
MLMVSATEVTRPSPVAAANHRRAKSRLAAVMNTAQIRSTIFTTRSAPSICYRQRRTGRPRLDKPSLDASAICVIDVEAHIG